MPVQQPAKHRPRVVISDDLSEQMGQVGHHLCDISRASAWYELAERHTTGPPISGTPPYLHHPVGSLGRTGHGNDQDVRAISGG